MRGILPGRTAGRLGRPERHRSRGSRGHCHHFRDGHRGRCAASRSSGLPGLARVGAIQPDASRRRWARRQSSLAWQLDDRAAPDTVPIKVVPHWGGKLGRSRPALTAQSCGVEIPSSPSVAMRWVPCAGRLVQPRLLAPKARRRLWLPALARRTHPARRGFTALARTHRAASCSGRQ